MTFPSFWNPKEKIEALERWILVQSMAYYELNDNISSDYNYDNNVNLLFDIYRECPENREKSRYYEYFKAYEPGCTSGFELLDKVRKNNKELYRHLQWDAINALQMKEKKDEY